MRKFLIFLLLAVLIGSAGALPRWGPPNGFYVKQLEADTITADVISAGVNITKSGALEANIGIGGGYDFTFGSGDGKMDLSAGTGVFKSTKGTNTLGGDVVIVDDKTFTTGTGAIALNGDITVASGKDITMSGAGTLTSGTGAVTLAGPTTIANLAAITAGSGSAAYNLVASTGAFTTSTGTNTLSGNVVISGSKTFTSGTGAVALNGPTTIANLAAITAGSGSAAYDLSASTGAFKTPQGAVTINGATTFAANKGIAMTAGTGAMDFSLGTGVFKTTTGAVTVGPADVTVSGNASFSKNVAYSLNATTSINTTLVDDNTKTVFGINAAAGDRSLTLPAANTVTGRLYMIAASADMGTNYVIVDTTGTAKIGGTNGADSLKSTSADAALSVISDGTNYLVISKVGTWS